MPENEAPKAPSAPTPKYATPGFGEYLKAVEMQTPEKRKAAKEAELAAKNRGLPPAKQFTMSKYDWDMYLSRVIIAYLDPEGQVAAHRYPWILNDKESLRACYLEAMAAGHLAVAQEAKRIGQTHGHAWASKPEPAGAK